MSKWIEISFRHPPDVHRIRNFAEHLVRQLYDRKLGVLSMDDADRAFDRICITGIRTRMLNRSLGFLKQAIVDNGFSGDATMTSGTEGEG